METLVNKLNKEIDFLCTLHKVPIEVRKHITNTKKDHYGRAELKLHSPNKSVEEWLQNFRDSCNGSIGINIMDSLERIVTLCEFIRSVRENFSKAEKKLSVYEKAKEDAKSRFENLFARFFPRASGELKAEVCTDKHGFACSLTATRESSYYNQHKITIPITWHKKIADNNLHYIPSGRRTYFTINLVKEDNKYLKEKNISCFRGTLLDPAYKKRDKEYGYAFSPELLSDQVVLIKQDIAGNYTFGVGHNVHKAESLLSRRTNAKVMKSILGE